jgi:REP element-mobilizing transposase RayT
MARPPRDDPQDGWHHLWDRGIAKKPIFEKRSDIRRFMAALARAVRRGDIEVHSFVFMTTHVHLLVRSPKGRLSHALGRILADFTRHYNRSRDRDGTVWRGRFCSKPVTSHRYRRALVRYIDQNPVQAGMSATPWAYEHGSAQRFVFRTPKWLSRSWVDAEIRIRTGRSPAEGGSYQEAFPRAGEGVTRLIDARVASAARGPDPLDDLVAAAPEKVRRWMEERSRLADGTKPGHPIVDPGTLLDVLTPLQGERPSWKVCPRRKPASAIRIMRVALLRDLSGQSYTAIARAVGVSDTKAKSLYQDHQVLMVRDAQYAQAAVELTLQVLAAANPD